MSILGVMLTRDLQHVTLETFGSVLSGPEYGLLSVDELVAGLPARRRETTDTFSPDFVVALEGGPYCWAPVGDRSSGHDPPPRISRFTQFRQGLAYAVVAPVGRLSAVLGA